MASGETNDGRLQYFKNKKIDTNIMGKKGAIGEEIIKRYILKQPELIKLYQVVMFTQNMIYKFTIKKN